MFLNPTVHENRLLVYRAMWGPGHLCLKATFMTQSGGPGSGSVLAGMQAGRDRKETPMYKIGSWWHHLRSRLSIAPHSYPTKSRNMTCWPQGWNLTGHPHIPQLHGGIIIFERKHKRLMLKDCFIITPITPHRWHWCHSTRLLTVLFRMKILRVISPLPMTCHRRESQNTDDYPKGPALFFTFQLKTIRRVLYPVSCCDGKAESKVAPVMPRRV